MIALKKLYGDELLRLALMLSLLRADPEQYLRLDEATLLAGGIVNGTERTPEISGYYHRSRTLHPKSLDSILLDYERDIFEEMMSLGRWSGSERSNRATVQTYLLNGVESANGQQQETAAVVQDAEDYYSHLPAVQLDDDQEEQCVTIKTENDTQDDESYEYSCASVQSGFQQEVEIKSEDYEDSEVKVEVSDPEYETYSAVGPGFIRNLSTFHGPLLEEDSATSMSIDVSQFFANPPLKIESKPGSSNFGSALIQDDNALDQYMPFYLQNIERDSITNQNLADLADFDETPETMEEFKRRLERLDVKRESEEEDFGRYLIKNDEQEFDGIQCVKRERASTSFTSVTSSSGLSESTDVFASGSSTSGDESLIVDFGDFKIEKDEGLYSGEELTLEDMDLIEVLWKQDVDMGFSLDTSPGEKFSNNDGAYSQEGGALIGAKLDEDDEIERLKNALKESCEDGASKNLELPIDNKLAENMEDNWSGLPYTIDLETGEYVLSEDPERFDLLEEALQLVGLDDATTDLNSELKSELSATAEQQEPEKEPKQEPESAMLAPRYHPHAHPHHHSAAEHHHALGGPPPESQQHHHAAAHHHFAAAYHHQNLVRSVSMEQRWQDLAALLALPGPNAPPPSALGGPPDPHHHHLYQQHHHHHVNPSLGHCSQATSGYVGPPYAPLATEKASIPTPDLYGGSNLGSAVAASMNVSHGPSGCTAAGGGPPPFYKAEHPGLEHQNDTMYYQNNGTNELNGTSDGFLSSILNEDDLQLMDMAMNEGMYTMRMLESGGGGNVAAGGAPLHLPHQTQPPHPMSSHHIAMGSERIDASSDSAVSSMGSERVPSLSDGEWCDAGSDSAQDFHHSKMRPCESESRQPPLVAQKKHHMFGKRCFQDQTNIGRLRNSMHEEHPMSDIKYEYEQPTAPSATYIPDVGHMTPEFAGSGAGIGIPPTAGSLRHNHTYSLPPAPPQPPHRPLARDKKHKRGPESSSLASCGTHGPLSRDEKKARALGIPLSVHDIINLPMDEFNERLSKHDLSETQLSLIRDIRRRGKNKVAAQNCRKRKLDQITSLADEVRDVRMRKQKLQRERHMLLAQRQRAKEHFAALYRHVFQHLRDADGNPLSSQQYSLQQAADGAVVLVPRASASLLPDSRSPRSVDRHLSTNGTSDDDLERIKIKQRKSFDQ